MFKIGLNQDFQQIKQDQYVYSKGEVYKPTGAVRPAWWNVRRWKLSSEFGLGWLGIQTNIVFVQVGRHENKVKTTACQELTADSGFPNVILDSYS